MSDLLFDMPLNQVIAALERDLAQLRIMRGDTVGFLYTTLDRKIAWSSPGFTELLGYPSADAVGQRPFQLLRPGVANSTNAYNELTRLLELIRRGEINETLWSGYVQHAAGHWLLVTCRASAWRVDVDVIGYVLRWERVDVAESGAQPVRVEDLLKWREAN